MFRVSKKILGIAVLVFAMNNAFSQNTGDTADSNVIDRNLKACLDSDVNGTTAGMIYCTAEAESRWDAEMNKYYKLLQKTLSSEEMAKLKASQIKWLEFRDAEFSTANKIYDDMHGTMWRIVSVDTDMEIVKQRALELKSYYNYLTMH